MQETTHRALKTIKALPEGYPGTFDNPEREHVPDDVVRRTLPFMIPMLRAMVVIQWLTGMRPSEVVGMRVGQIDQTSDSEFWYYTLKQHKTEKHIGKKLIPLGKAEQELIAPYLSGKEPESAVFCPHTAMQEHKAQRLAARKTKIVPSQEARAKANAAKPSKYREFYTPDSYRKAIIHAIKKANKHLPEGEKIPHWFPYQLRHSTATALTKVLGKALAQAQAQLGHTKSKMTENYAKDATLEIMEELARNRRNPFDTDGQDKDAA